MRESREASLAMIVPQAAFSDTPERKTVIGKVHDRIIDASPAKGDFSEDLFLRLIVLRK